MSDALRTEIENWLAGHWRTDRDLSEWRAMLLDAGWAAPGWPHAYYGRGFSDDAQKIVADAFFRARAVPAIQAGPGILAAETLLVHGDDAQKRRFLAAILTGQDSWCQLFSEPGSGSDLAGATTKAERAGDQWVVNGQKLWSTSAHHADWGILLARTDWDAPKHEGLSFFLLDMRQPGVEVRPLRQMNGYASFNEVFLTDARISADCLVGAPGDGWKIAMTTLAVERRGFARANRDKQDWHDSGPIYDQYRAEQARAMEPYTWYPQRTGRVDLVLPRARATGRLADPALRQQIAALLMMDEAAQDFAARLRAAQEAGETKGAEGSISKLAASRIARLAAEIHTDISGIDAMAAGPDSIEGGLIAETLLSTPAISIAGGTDEIQKNILSERLLDMPKEHRFDKGPFRDVKRNG